MEETVVYRYQSNADVQGRSVAAVFQIFTKGGVGDTWGVEGNEYTAARNVATKACRRVTYNFLCATWA